MPCGKQEDGGYLSTNRGITRTMTSPVNEEGEEAHSIDSSRILEGRLPSVRLQHMGNKKVYETASDTESRVAISRYEFLKKSMQAWDCGRHGPQCY